MPLSEDQHSIELAIWLDRRNILYTHVPNGGKRGRVEAAKFQRMGVKRGVPDYLIFTPPPVVLWEMPGGGYRPPGMAIELKKETGGKTSADQHEWIRKLSALGWIAIVCKGHKAAIEQLTKYNYDQIFEKL